MMGTSGNSQREQMVMGRAVSWQDIKGIFKIKDRKRGEGGGQSKGEKKKGSKTKKQGQYTQRNVLQTVELAKLKCTVTMGTLEEKEEKKKINNEIQKKGRDNMYF